MERLQRSFTKLTSKGPGDNAKVALILKDYDDAEKFLGKVSEKKQPSPLYCVHNSPLAQTLTFYLPPRSSTAPRHCGTPGSLLRLPNTRLSKNTPNYTIRLSDKQKVFTVPPSQLPTYRSTAHLRCEKPTIN